MAETKKIELFTDLLGQNRAVKQILESYSRERIPQAYIFSGPEGVGKRSAALILAQLLNCQSPQKNPPNPCQKCANCKKFISDNFVDLWQIEPEGQQIKIDQLRELQKIVRFPPTEGGWRISIILDSEKMNREAANAFLKLLEEPPPKNLFIMIVQRPQLLLPTIRSRCQLVTFSPLSREKLEEFLAKTTDIPIEKARLISTIADGSPGRAIEIIEKFSLEKRREWCEIIKDALSSNLSASQIISFAAQFRKENREELRQFMKIYSLWLRDLLFTAEKLYNNIANIDFLEEVKSLSKKLDHERIEKLLRRLDYSERALKFYSSPTMTAESLLLYTVEITGENK